MKNFVVPDIVDLVDTVAESRRRDYGMIHIKRWSSHSAGEPRATLVLRRVI